MERQHLELIGIKYIALLFTILYLVMPVYGLSEPNPIAVKAITNYNVGVSNLNVIITNERTHERVLGKTDVNGEFLTDWSNSQLKYQIGDAFTIQVDNIVKSITYSGYIGIVTFDFTGKIIVQQCPICNPCTPCAKTECPPIACPVADCPDISCPTVSCPELVQPSCPSTDTTLNYIATLLLSLLVGTGVGLSIYRDEKGNIKINVRSHRHFGVNYLHSIYTVHREPYTHGYGEPLPIYKNGKYIINPKYPKKVK